MGAAGLPAVINRLAAAFRIANITTLVLTVLVSFLPVSGFVMFSLMFNNDSDRITLDAAGILRVLLLNLLIFAACPWCIAAYQQRTAARRLKDSSVVGNLIAGHAVGFHPTEHVPVLLRYNLGFPPQPGAFSGGILAVLWLVGYNLDWYLNPRRPFLRSAWFAAPVMIALNLLAIIGLSDSHLNRTLLTPHFVEIIMIGLIGSLILTHDAFRRFLYTELLVRHLRELVD